MFRKDIVMAYNFAGNKIVLGGKCWINAFCDLFCLLHKHYVGINHYKYCFISCFIQEFWMF